MLQRLETGRSWRVFRYHLVSRGARLCGRMQHVMCLASAGAAASTIGPCACAAFIWCATRPVHCNFASYGAPARPGKRDRPHSGQGASSAWIADPKAPSLLGDDRQCEIYGFISTTLKYVRYRKEPGRASARRSERHGMGPGWSQSQRGSERALSSVL